MQHSQMLAHGKTGKPHPSKVTFEVVHWIKKYKEVLDAARFEILAVIQMQSKLRIYSKNIK